MKKPKPRAVQAVGRPAAAVLATLAALLAFPSCSSSPEKPAEVPGELPWNGPQFEPDYVRLELLPGVSEATLAESDYATVLPDTLEFPVDKAPSVRHWEKGRIVVGAPSENPAGRNPMGYSRRVVAVVERDGKFIVKTEYALLDKVAAGDFQARVDQGRDIDLNKFTPEMKAQFIRQFHDAGMEPELLFADAGNRRGLKRNRRVGGAKGGPGAQWPWDGVVSQGRQALNNNIKQTQQLAEETYKEARKIGGQSLQIVGEAIQNALPPNLQGTLNFDDELKYEPQPFDVFKDLTFKKEFNQNGRVPFEIEIKGSLAVQPSIKLNPGFQVGARFPNPLALGKGELPRKLWINVDSQITAGVKFAVDLEASISTVTVGGSKVSKGTQAFVDKVDKNLDVAAKVYADEREALTGDEDLQPTPGFRKTLFMTTPKLVMVGKVPVTFVGQIDLVCGASMMAKLNGTVELKTTANLKFNLNWEEGSAPTAVLPTLTYVNTQDIRILGGGTLEANCGIVPRMNILVADTAGIYVGPRASAVFEAEYESSCQANVSRPSGSLELALKANVGILGGVRAQTPGSSLGRTATQNLGTETSPRELWNKEWDIWSEDFDVPGIGYCTPLCQNRSLDSAEPAEETDVDCGGSCTSSCAVGKKCEENTDCAAGLSCESDKRCGANTCTDGVLSGKETDVDCGGTCTTKCAVNQRCAAPGDCSNGFCSIKTAVCVANSCEDGRRSGQESGVDCGGPCAKCQVGQLSSRSDDCVSGMVNRAGYCVSDACQDGVKNGDETDIDCGGKCETRCGFRQLCNSQVDCQGGFECLEGEVSEGFFRRSGRMCMTFDVSTCQDKRRNNSETDVDCGGSCPFKCDTGNACTVNADCQTGTCNPASRRCETVSCEDRQQNGLESDVDCGGELCQGCEVGKGCSQNADCASNVCINTRCMSARSLGGVARGLLSRVVLRMGGEVLQVGASGPFTFVSKKGRGEPYAVTVETQPSGQLCTVAQSSGVVWENDVRDILVDCVSTTGFTVGGAIRGLQGTLRLRNGTSAPIGFTANGPFRFPQAYDSDATYDVQVETQPPGQTCTVTKGSGTIRLASVADVEVSCEAESYTLGGLVSGLIGTVVLGEGARTVAVSAPGAFTFPNGLLYDRTFDVVVRQQPPGQVCTVSNGTGRITGNVANVDVQCDSTAYPVGGVVSGLTGTVRLLYGTEEVIVTANGGFTFPRPALWGQQYSVVVGTQPAGQTCSVSGGTGTIAGPVSTIGVTCSTLQFTLGGTLTGATGALVLSNGAQSLNLSGDSSFSFAQPLAVGSSYTVTVTTPPANQTCVVTNGSGTMGTTAVSNVVITCSTITRSVGGTVTGASGSLVLQNNGGDALNLNGDASFTFSQPVPAGSAYAITVLTPPANQSCVVTNGSGTMGTSAVANVTVTCTTTTGTVGGTIAGATGPLVLTNNGSDTFNATGDGLFTFGQAVASGTAYGAVVLTPPANQTCAVTNGSGVMGASNVTNVSVVCSTNTFAVGGTVSGASGPLVIRNNGTDTLNLGGDGAFSFTQRVATFANYAVTVLTPPAGQQCTVNSGVGQMGSSDVAVSIVCAVAVNPLDCAEILAANPAAANGVYRIDSDGPSGDLAYDVYCDMTGGGWTQLGDQDIALVSGGRTGDLWGYVEDTAPNAGAFSQLVRLADFSSNGSYRMSLRWGNAEDRYINWDQSERPNASSGRGTVSNVSMVPSGQVGFAGAFQGLGLDLAQQGVYIDGEGGAATGSWAFGLWVAVGGGIPAYAGSSQGALTTNRARIYVKRIPPGPAFKRVFVTSTTYAGSLGGTVGADNLCQTRATAGGLTGTFKAWLATSASSDPESTFVRATVPYRRMDGVDIALNWADLTDGTLAAPLNVTELNTTQATAGVWSGATASGTDIGVTNCNGYTNGSSGISGQNGSTTATNGGWTQAGGFFCNSQYALYCFEQ